jgi:hypothetical protein
MTFSSFAFSARARCDLPRLLVGKALSDQPGRFDVGPDEKRGLLGLTTGLLTGVVMGVVTGLVMSAAEPDGMKKCNLRGSRRLVKINSGGQKRTGLMPVKVGCFTIKLWLQWSSCLLFIPIFLMPQSPARRLDLSDAPARKSSGLVLRCANQKTLISMEKTQ